MIRVRALKMGFFGGVRRRAGDVFDVPSKKLVGKWMDIVLDETPVTDPVDPSPPDGPSTPKGKTL